MNNKWQIFNRAFFVLLAFLAIFFQNYLFSFAQYEEYIELFDSKIFVNKDATLKVQETIVYVNNGKRVRGIYKDFPTRYNYAIFTEVAHFKLLSVECNGKKENFKQETVYGGQRIYIGKEDVFLKPGKYTYKIEYGIDKVLGYYSDHDELYWDVNGTGWRMPIAKVQAKVFLPKGLKISYDAYTGFSGKKGKDFVISQDEIACEPDNKDFLQKNNNLCNDFSVVSFCTTKSFEPGENITIAVGWPIGFIVRPSGLAWFSEFIKDNLLFIFSILLFILFLIFSIILYIKHSRSQNEETVIPLFYPPNGFSPSDVRYFSRFSYDSKTFASEIVNMAVHGLIQIKYEKTFFSGVYTLIRNKLDNPDAGVDLSGKRESAEIKSQLKYEYILNYLFAKKTLGQLVERVKLDNVANSKVVKAYDSLRGYVAKTCNKYFIGISGWYIAAYIFSLLFIFLSFISNQNYLQIVIGVFFAVLFGFFMLFLKGYTPDGLKIKAQIDGFKMFLETTEEDRLKVIGTPPEKTPQLYEKYLPYSIALGVEKQWSKKFAPVFERLAREGKPYMPYWYFGPGPFVGFDSQTFAANLSKVATDLSKSVSQSSGLGGGGSSGGGRGGGGGGSW